MSDYVQIIMREKFEQKQTIELVRIETEFDDLISQVDALMVDGQIPDEKVVTEILQKLYTALAINNSEEVAERIRLIEEQYGRK